MSSPPVGDDEVLPTKPRKPSTPRRTSAVKRSTPNVTPKRKVSANKAATPNSAPARPKTIKPGATLLGDFLLGRPSPYRARRRSLDVIKAEMKVGSVSKLQPPGGVKDRVRKWQKASAAAVIEDPMAPASEPMDIMEEVDEESVNEDDRLRIKQRIGKQVKRGARSPEEEQPNLGTPKIAPKKRVVSDDHWMQKKKRKSPPRRTPINVNLLTGTKSYGKTLPKDFVQRHSVNPPLESKIQDWASRVNHIEPKSSESRLTESPKQSSTIESIKEKYSPMKVVEDGALVTPPKEKRLDDGTRVRAMQDKERMSFIEDDVESQKRTPRRRNEKPSRPRPGIQESRRVSKVTGTEDNKSTSPKEAKPRRQRSATPPESLAEIPVGYSAFSVLSIPVGGEASATRPLRQQRNPSLSLPNVIKKVYSEGMKIVHDTMDPPRTGLNQPPSIESWLKGTSDPFVDHQPNAKLSMELPKPKLRQPSYEKENRPRSMSRQDSESDAEYPESIGRRKPHSRNSQKRPEEHPMRENENSQISRKTPQEEANYHADNVSHLSPTGLRRSPATRAASSPKLARKSPLRDILVDAFRGESEPLRPKRLPAISKDEPQVWEEEPKNFDSDRGALPTSRASDHQPLMRTDNSPLRRSPRMSDISSFNVPKTRAAPEKAVIRRKLPTTGNHKLSTIASIRASSDGSSVTGASSLTGTSSVLSQTTVTQNTSNSSYTEATESNISRQLSSQPGLKRRLTKHSDLLSVLSLQDQVVPGSKGIRSARSIRTTRTRLATAIIPNILQEVRDDEVKYMRELRTLVDGVIPVLLTCVLSKSNSAVAAGLFDPTINGGSDSSITKPIVDMGIALEQLKSLHKRIPLQDLNQFVHWASSAYKVYNSYLTAWRMGFQDVVINLAPASNTTEDDDSLLDEMPRNADGDVVNGDGERVDVAFLLKRPLVRIKYMAKAAKGLHTLSPSEMTERLNEQYQDLLNRTRRRTREEGARLEDQLASNTDPTRARDPKTLAHVEGVKIDHSRQVRAKDYFGFDLSHSSGQRMGCEVELLLRDKTNDPGDVLICEVDARKDRWLLFPPIELDRISARLGDNKRELVVMIRGVQGSKEWREFFTLSTDDEENALEWIQMLGQDPMPPHLASRSDYHQPVSPFEPGMAMMSGGLGLDAVEIPIGEKRGPSAKSAPDGRNRELRRLFSPPISDHVIDDPRVSSAKTKDLKEAIIGRARGSAYGLRKSPVESQTRSSLSLDVSQPVNFKSHESANNYDCSSPESLGRTDIKRRTPMLPLLEMPHIPKQRKTVQPQSSDEDKGTPLNALTSLEIPAHGDLDPSKHAVKNDYITEGEPPAPPAHTSSSPPTLKQAPFLSSIAAKFKTRRSSSPLKHEYQPSTLSALSSASEASDSDSHGSSSSDSSEDEELEGADVSSPLPVFRPRVSTRGLPYTLPNGSRASSTAASQRLSKGIQAPSDARPFRAVASISTWSDKGHWLDLHPEECSIVITPGLIEAFVMSASHSSGNPRNMPLQLSEALDIKQETDAGAEQPLVALGLTPVVPLRRSTAIDIEIRSPPLPNSKLRPGDAVRFRTRTLQDCTALYVAIHYARLDNPVYKQLEQERILSTYGGNSYEAAVGGNRRRSWFGRKKSYRASARAPSTTTSEKSSKSLTSAVSRLRQRMSSGGVFNIEKSFIDMPQVDGAAGGTSYYTSSSESTSSEVTPPRTPSIATTTNTLQTQIFSHENLEIQLYLLETSSRWAELGAAHLSITSPPPGMRQALRMYQGIEKRITLTGKLRSKQMKLLKAEDLNENGEVTLLDIVLGARCFTRQGIVGVCMNVWQEIVGDNGQIGTVGASGGVSGRTRKYMFQCANAAQARWVFALVGGGGW